MEFCRFDLYQNSGNKYRTEDQRADKVTPTACIRSCLPEPRHRDRIATGFAQRRRKDLDDPENKCHFRNFAGRISEIKIEVHICMLLPSWIAEQAYDRRST